MSRLILAFVLLLFSFNAASASGLLGCCDMGKTVKIEAKAENTPPPCHEMSHDKADKNPAPQKAKHCLCASMCAAKSLNSLDTPPFTAVAFDLAVSHGANDMAVSIDRQPESPPPKI